MEFNSIEERKAYIEGMLRAYNELDAIQEASGVNDHVYEIVQEHVYEIEQEHVYRLCEDASEEDDEDEDEKETEDEEDDEDSVDESFFDF